MTMTKKALAALTCALFAMVLVAAPATAQSEPQPPASTPTTTAGPTDGGGVDGGGEVGMAPDERDSSRLLASTGTEVMQLAAIGFLLVAAGVVINQVRRERSKARGLRGA